MFFPDEPVPLDSVRDIAALLEANNLGEIALKSSSESATMRLKMTRPTLALAPVAPLAAPVDAVGESEEAVVETGAQVADVPAATEQFEVLAPCVGVFRAGKKQLLEGDEVKARQIVGVVESLRVPNEVYAPFDGTVAQMIVVEGQGVEWGQTLLVLEPK